MRESSHSRSSDSLGSKATADELSLSAELLDFCISDSLSEEGLRTIIEKNGLTPDNNLHGIDDFDLYDIFDGACCNEYVTEEIIRLLIEYFPNAPGLTHDDDGCTPLHTACENKNMTANIIQLLLEAAPDSVRAADEDGDLPIYDLCDNEDIDEKATLDILKLLLEKYPESSRHTNNIGNLPLHIACQNKNMTVNIVRLLIEAAPDSVSTADGDGDLPIYHLCYNDELDEKAALDILKLLLGKHPDSSRHTNNEGKLPLHYASETTSPDFCLSLIESHPASLRVMSDDGELPLHRACMHVNFPTVKLLQKLYPDAINHATSEGYYPIHYAMVGLMQSVGKNDPNAAPDLVQFLLDCDPRVKLQKCDGNPLLYFAFVEDYDYSNVENILQMIKAICDAHPDSLRSPNEKGRLPIHDYVCYCNTGKIKGDKAARKILKVLLDKYPASTQCTDDEGNLPLHLACEKGSPEFCQLLIESYPDSVQVSNDHGFLPLHYACNGNTLPTVEYLYEVYPDAINHETSGGYYPIHGAMILNRYGRNDPEAALGIVQFLLDCDPKVKLQKFQGDSLLHFACAQGYNDSNVKANAQMIEAICDAHPDSLRSPTEDGQLPIHSLCCCCTTDADTDTDTGESKDEKVAMKILEVLLDKYPASTQCTDDEGNLPLHSASRRRSPEFCQLLIESYPDSVQVSNVHGFLPIHNACNGNTLPTVEYLYEVYPDAVHHTTPNGYLIHFAIMGSIIRRNPEADIGIVQFLLDCDPRVILQKIQVGEKSLQLLHFACLQFSNVSLMTDDEVGIEIIKLIYDAHPEAIEDGNIRIDIEPEQHEDFQSYFRIEAFIHGEMIYARHARDLRLMTTPDEHGQLPLHRILRINARLGSIKLLLKGNRFAPNAADNNGSLPLHVACEFHSSPRVIEHLVDLYPTTIRCLDFDQNNVLHYACRGANYIVIALLLDKYDATSVSMRNTRNELPIDLLFKSSAVEDRESIEYTDCVFRLLRAYPESLL